MVAATASKPPLRARVDVGTNEGSNPQQTVAVVRSVADELQGLGFRPGADLDYREVPGASHDEASWAARLPEVLAFLFP